MSQLSWALEYAARGWRVMPTHWMIDGRCSCGRDDCGSPGKHPRPRKGSHDATVDDRQIDGWWRWIWPTANIGIATGRVSGLYVIDLDGADALAEWAALELVHGDADTLACRTGGGGRHLYFAIGNARLPNTVKRIAPHIDSRGEGGYVLAPESNHASGHSYEWEQWPRTPASLPGWLYSRVRGADAPAGPRPPAPIRRAENDDRVAVRIIDEEARAVAATQPGGRNDQLFRSATNLFSLAYGGDVRMESAVAAMRDAAAACGLGEHETENTLKSALDAARETPRRIRTRLLEGGTA